jgi:hypothetical protein
MANEKASSGQGREAKNSKSRGTQDDIEVLKLIIEEHPGLKKRILEKIRIARGLKGPSSESETSSKEK